MEGNSALVVSDSFDRRDFLAYYLKHLGMKPIWYPSIMGAMKAVRVDSFSMVVIDLLLPVEPKLTLINDANHYQPNTQIMTIGKKEYLKQSGVLSPFPSVVSIDSIESFPDKLNVAMFVGSFEVTNRLIH